MKVVEEIDLPVRPQMAWRVLTDLERYPHWISTFRLEGEMAPGAELTYAFRARKRRMFRLPVRVIHFAMGQGFSLRGGVPGVLRWDQSLTLVRTIKGARLVHELEWNGLLVMLVGRARITRKLHLLGASFNRCLQAYCVKVAKGTVRLRREGR